MRSAMPGGLAGVALLLVACGSETTADGAHSATADEPWFVELSEQAGLDFVHVNVHTLRYWMPEISPGAVAFLDYDGDDLLDVYCIQSGDIQPAAGRELEVNRLFHNEGGGRFRDVTAAAGVGDDGYGNGCATGDYDGDGDVDLFVTNFREDVLYRNNGDGSFSDVTDEAGVAGGQWSTASAFLDYDADGDLDLFVVHNLNWAPALAIECRTAQSEVDYCSPKNFEAPSLDTLFRNDGGGTFTDVSASAGIAEASGIGLGIAVADYDNDGDQDIFVANDSVPNLLWINDGQGHFVNDALGMGCAVNMSGASEAGMGVQAVDLENDGDWDLFMTHVRDETNTFYLNSNGTFTDQTPATGLSAASRRYTGFGMAFHDFDHDGVLDVFVANGRVDLSRPFFDDARPFDEPNQLFRGLSGGRFEEFKSGPTGQRLLGTSRAAAFGDFDNDGDVDVLYQDLHAPVRLLRNEAPKRGHWIGFRVLDRRGSDALGAVVRIETASGAQYRQCLTAYSYCAANDARVHFGLGAATELSAVIVTWRGEQQERFPAPAVDAYHELREGAGQPAAK